MCFYNLHSNAKVQVAAVDSGVLQHLVKILSVDPSLSVRKKAVFAISALLRQFPYAQKKFLQLGGLSALAELFVGCKSESLQVRIVTMLTDLLLEYVSTYTIHYFIHQHHTSFINMALVEL